MVKILAPVSSLEAATEVVAAGADEIYCGVIVPRLRYMGLSVRIPWCSLSSYKELGEVVQYAHKHGVKTIVTTEFPFMAEVIEKKVRKHILSCVERDIDALIATDIGSILMIKEMDLRIPIYASTYLASMNYQAVDFLKNLGIERIILESRHLMIDEIKEIVIRSKDVELEAFIHGGGCSNINVNCYGCTSVGRVNRAKFDSYLHGGNVSTICRATYDVSELGSAGWRKIGSVPILDAYSVCSFCQLPELLGTGLTGLKIVGRCMPPFYQKESTRIYHELVELIEQNQMETYLERLESFRKSNILPSDACDQKRCYYSPLFHAPYKTFAKADSRWGMDLR